jgi:hypothetical protein
LHPDTELRFVSDEIGYGVVAVRLIPKGTFTWVLDDLDQIVDPRLEYSLPPVLAALLYKYSYLEPRGRVLCWDHAKYLNHSCEPNCRSTGFDLELAVRDIQPGEQLTDDYGSLNVNYEFDCRCGAPGCRRTIRASDLTAFADDWDREARDAFRFSPHVPQPLWSLLGREHADIERAFRGEIPVPSCRAHAIGVSPDAGA